MNPSALARGTRVLALCVALVLCVWLGWRDVDPWMARDDVREAIRLTVRRSVQIAIQFVAPAVLLALLGRELQAFWPARARGG